jgi:hypothetical protein
MKQGEVFFHPMEGSGLLSISWSSGPKGAAIESKNGLGVGFFSDKGDLLCVIFDEVQAENDHQILDFPRYDVELTIKNSQITYSVTRHAPATDQAN